MDNKILVLIVNFFLRICCIPKIGQVFRRVFQCERYKKKYLKELKCYPFFSKLSIFTCKHRLLQYFEMTDRHNQVHTCRSSWEWENDKFEVEVE